MLRRFAAFPLREGQVSIGPMTVEFETGSVFSLLGPPGRTLRREGVEVALDAKPLPEANRPTGPVVVGTFTLEGRLDRAQVATGDAVTLTVVAEGSGNIHDITLQPEPVDGVKILNPEIRDQVQSPNDLVGGSRTFSWLLIPEEPGSHVLPPIALHTFNPSSKQFATVRTEALTVVAAGNPVATQSSTEASEPQGERDRAERVDLGPVRNQSELARKRRPLSRTPVYLVLALAPPLLWVALLLAAFVRRMFEAHDSANAGKRALKGARKRLAASRATAQSGNAPEFYGEVQRVLRDALEGQLAMPIGGFTHKELRDQLAARGMQQDLVARVVDELEGLEFASFSAAGTTSDEMERCAERIHALLDRIDRFESPPTEAP
jgi:hypothetical protein